MNKKITLTLRDRLILEHLATYEISTKAILHRTFFEGKRMDAVVSTQRRLDSRGVGYIYGRRIPGSRTICFRLTKKGADFLGIETSTQPLPVTKLFALLGKLYFINRPKPNHHRTLCDNEVLKSLIDSEDLENGKIRPPRVDFYIAQNKIEGSENTEVALGAILPDLNSKVRRVVDRCVNHSKGFIERGWFVDVMRAGRFEWTILTGHPAKAEELATAATRALRKRLRKTYFRFGLDSNAVPPIRVKVEVIPELANLRLTRNNKKEPCDSPKPVSRSRKNNRRR